jgi:hypothetical protein
MMHITNRNPSYYRKESSSDNPVQNAGAAPLGGREVRLSHDRSVEISFG